MTIVQAAPAVNYSFYAGFTVMDCSLIPEPFHLH